MSSIEFRQLEKGFGANRLFDCFNLKIPSAQLTVLLGPSGCGKTTLLRLIAGLETPDAGAIVIDGQDVTRLEPKRRGVAMVFQNYALYPHLTVRENLAFPLRIAKLPKEEIAGRVSGAAELLGLTAMLERFPKTLSGGERQRTAVGRAIVRDPRLFLFDEPLSNLDFQLRNRMRSELVALQRKLGKTMVYVTHDQTEGMTMADTLVLLDRGRIRQLGEPDQIYRRPANLFAARFIGSPPMNIFSGMVTGGILGLDDSDQKLCDVQVNDGLYQVGVRPNQLEVTDSPAGVVLVVDYTEFHGSDSFVTGKIDGQQFTMIGRPDTRYARAERIKVSFPPQALHFFARDTGDRIATG